MTYLKFINISQKPEATTRKKQRAEGENKPLGLNKFPDDYK